MSLIETLNEINDEMKVLYEFVQTDEKISPDFVEYLSTMGAKNATGKQMERVFLPYIFERRIGENAQTIVEIFAQNRENEITKSLTNANSSIFEIKRLLKNGFELYNIINEKTYKVLSLTKMSALKGIGAGQFIVARTFNYEGEHYLVEIASVLSEAQKADAMRYAIMKIIQNPQVVYLDNEDKEAEIKAEVESMYSKFIECFGTDEILTTNRYADEIIGLFNDYEIGTEKPEISEMTKPLENFKYFEVKEFNNSYNNFIENSMGGFSSHKDTYDVAIIFDKELGLYAVPFYQTLCKIFENSETIENAQECLKYFLENDAISANLIKRVASKYPNFIEKTNELMNEKFTLKSLLEKYKSEYLTNTIYSSTTVLFKSSVFSNALGIIEEQESKPVIDTQNIGRNDPCPCGSGKKFKNCCLNS